MSLSGYPLETGQSARPPVAKVPSWEDVFAVTNLSTEVSNVRETPLNLRTARWLTAQVIFHTHKISTDFKTLHITKTIVVDVPEWLPFGDWSECTATCGQGSKVRARACSHQPINGSEQCDGNAFEFETCKMAECPGEKLEYILNSVVLDRWFLDMKISAKNVF